MGVFDSELNIECTPIKLLLKRLPSEISFVMSNGCLWFIETNKNQTTVNGELMSGFRATNFVNVCDLFEDIKPVMKEFDEKFDTLQINIDGKKTIPELLGEVMEGYKPEGSPLIITPTKYFIAFNNNISERFKIIYEGYCLRYKMWMRGFDIDPDKIGYLHVCFTSNECNTKIPWDTKLTVHWFYPLAMVDHEESK